MTSGRRAVDAQKIAMAQGRRTILQHETAARGRRVPADSHWRKAFGAIGAIGTAFALLFP